MSRKVDFCGKSMNLLQARFIIAGELSKDRKFRQLLKEMITWNTESLDGDIEDAKRDVFFMRSMQKKGVNGRESSILEEKIKEKNVQISALEEERSLVLKKKEEAKKILNDYRRQFIDKLGAGVFFETVDDMRALEQEVRYYAYLKRRNKLPVEEIRSVGR